MGLRGTDYVETVEAADQSDAEMARSLGETQGCTKETAPDLQPDEK